MSQLVKKILSTVDEQKKEIALNNCFTSWDGDIDIDVIAGGISDRLQAMGMEVGTISFERKVLNTVSILVDGDVAIVISRSTMYLSTVVGYTFKEGETYYQWMTVGYEGLFNDGEKELMSVWLLDNAHNL